MVAQKPQGIGQGLPLDNEKIAQRWTKWRNCSRPRRQRLPGPRLPHRRPDDPPVPSPGPRHEGVAGLTCLPGIGASLGRSIERLAHTGRLKLLLRCRPVGTGTLVCHATGVGSETADRVHEHPGVESLPELEAAANDGRLARVPGLGAKRLRVLRSYQPPRGRRSMQRTGGPTRRRWLRWPM